jgi:hypothetical protein
VSLRPVNSGVGLLTLLKGVKPRAMKSYAESTATGYQIHARILAVLHLLYSVSNLFVLAIWIGMFLLFTLFPSANRGEDRTNAELLTICLILIPVLVVPPLAAGYGLLRNRRWTKIAIEASAMASLVTLVGGLIFLWRSVDFSALVYVFVYVLLCLILISYSVWFLWARPQANNGMQRTRN